MSNKIKVKYSIELPDGTGKEYEASLNFSDGFKVEQLGQDPLKFVRNSFLLTCLSISKGISYSDSYRGGKGASKFKAEVVCMIGNIMRKYDRVMNCVERGIITGRVDGNGDLAVYSMLYMQLLEEFYPDEYKDWIQKEVIDFVNKEAKPDNLIVL